MRIREQFVISAFTLLLAHMSKPVYILSSSAKSSVPALGYCFKGDCYIQNELPFKQECMGT